MPMACILRASNSRQFAPCFASSLSAFRLAHVLMFPLSLSATTFTFLHARIFDSAGERLAARSWQQLGAGLPPLMPFESVSLSEVAAGAATLGRTRLRPEDAQMGGGLSGGGQPWSLPYANCALHALGR